MRNPRRPLAMAGLLLAAIACQDRQPVAPNLLQPRADSVRVCGAEGEAPCTLGPVTGTVDPIRPTDDEGGEDDGGTGGEGDVGGGGGGSGSGGGSTPSDDTAPSDTACRATGDTLVDKRQVQDIFDAVWAGSNADARDSWNRRERGGWIVRTPTGYAFQEFTDWRSEPCSMAALSSAAMNPPDNAVAWIHSHPFTVGEVPMSCKRMDPVTGLIVVSRYSGAPTVNDVHAGDEFNLRRKARGLPAIDGFIIDKDAIRRFKPLDLGGAHFDYAPIDRCAY